MPTGFEYLLTKQSIQSTVETALSPQIERLLQSAQTRLNPLLPQNSNQQDYSRDDVLWFLLIFTDWLRGEWLDEFSVALTSMVEPANALELAFWTRNGYAIPDGLQDSVAEAFSTERDWQRIANVTINRTVNSILKWDAQDNLTRRDLNALLDYWYSQSRARNIASSEATALNAALTKAYMERLGLRKFIWWTREDWRVCLKICRPKHGVVYDVTEPMPPDGSHAKCRCYPVPLFD